MERVELPEDLSDTTIIVIGLMEMGYDDIDHIAAILHRRDKAPLRKLIRMLKTSKNPTVRRCMDVGLPPGLVRQFPYGNEKVRCPLCRNMIDHAPCPRCSIAASRKPIAATEGSNHKVAAP